MNFQIILWKWETQSRAQFIIQDIQVRTSNEKIKIWDQVDLQKGSLICEVKGGYNILPIQFCAILCHRKKATVLIKNFEKLLNLSLGKPTPKGWTNGDNDTGEFLFGDNDTQGEYWKIISYIKVPKINVI